MKNKIGPVDGTDHVGGNYAAAINFETNLPNLLPENSNTDVGLFLDFGSVWGVDYDDTIDESNKIRSSTRYKCKLVITFRANDFCTISKPI